LLQIDPAKIPVVLGQTGTTVVFLIILVQAVLNFYAWRKSTEAAHLKGAVAALESEMVAYRSKADRQGAEITDLREEHEKCTRQLERVTKWYLEAKGEEEAELEHRRRKRS
jgi:hypothetical protein